jgi:hypothetical protein
VPKKIEREREREREKERERERERERKIELREELRPIGREIEVALSGGQTGIRLFRGRS